MKKILFTVVMLIAGITMQAQKDVYLTDIYEGWKSKPIENVLNGSIGIQQIALSIIAPIIGCALLFHTMHRRIGGYTGDCCGATFIISELMFYVALTLIVNYE